MYLWDDWENLMMPEYLKVLPFIKSVYKEHFSRQLCLEICKILRSYHWNWADLAYPLKEFIVKPYAYRGDLNLHEKRYNFALTNLVWLLKILLGDWKADFSVYLSV